jgi:hypothetical protein
VPAIITVPADKPLRITALGEQPVLEFGWLPAFPTTNMQAADAACLPLCCDCACRSKQNAVSKYFDADWVQRASRQGAAKAAAKAAAGGGPVVVDLHCCWNQTNTATGRLSSCSPNLQVR